ncbi:MAG: non-canonical purine NTP pyrophosphatase [Proteobacteria bacterium]|nr:non-canonical purine NTP pyrophosphatase [Pseudomonadota bacterium]
MPTSPRPYSFLSFATSNLGKFKEAEHVLPGLRLLSIELPELQELDTQKITSAKLQHVLAQGLTEVIVEDVALHFEGLNGLPGPLVKWFLKSLRAQGLYDMAARTGNLRVEVVAVVGYLDSHGKIFFFEGRVKGTLVPPRGGDGFGWDPIFVPEGSPKSFAEMSNAEKSTVSHRGRALEALRAHLKLK